MVKSTTQENYLELTEHIPDMRWANITAEEARKNQIWHTDRPPDFLIKRINQLIFNASYQDKNYICLAELKNRFKKLTINPTTLQIIINHYLDRGFEIMAPDEENLIIIISWSNQK